METAIDANAPLDYIEFHIFPSQNRYEACVSYLHKKEKVSSGLLEHLLQHSAKIRELHSKGSNAKYGLNPPEKSCDIKWFTKSTLIRFLHIIGSANILEVTESLKTEISQLEEARRFHLSLFTKDTKPHQDEESDDRSSSNGIGTTTTVNCSDSSKNKLLCAIDSRLTALGGELTSAFDQAAGSRYSVEEMTNIAKFSQHFGSVELSNSLHKHIELRLGALAIQNSGGNCDRGRSDCIDELVSLETRGSDGSSSEEERRPTRSRTLARSSSPRRSASPMRRVQIGRTGSRRSTAITIKSLNYIPAREKSFMPTASDSDEDEESQQEPEKSDNNVRISVQDAISLFERKQPKDENVKVRKSGSFLNSSVGTKKAVLGRWSSGCSDDSSDPVTNIQIKHDSQESENSRNDLCGSDAKSSTPEILPTEPTDGSEKLISSAEWNRQKEAELNELMMKMLETKPTKSPTVIPVSNKRLSLPSEQRGGFYDHYREKRDEKLQGEATDKQVEKEKQFKPSQRVPESRKLQPVSANANDAGRKYNATKMSVPPKSAAEPVNRRAQSPKPVPVKKVAPRSSSVPHTRKSVPTPRAPSPVKTPTTSIGTTPARRRPHSVTPASRSNPKVEASQAQIKPVKPNWNNSKKSMTKSCPTVKSKTQTAPEDHAPAPKLSLYSKVTKKSSIVPVESKPFLRRGSGTVSNANNLSVKRKTSASPQEDLSKSSGLNLDEKNITVSDPSDPVIHCEENEIGKTITVMENESTTNNNNIENVIEPQFESEEEEDETIMPAARVETDNHEIDNDTKFVTVDSSLVDRVPAGGSSPRIHHSLSQMLLDDNSSEPDIPECGNAEYLPQMVGHKDSAKGLKRLLKFGRKNKPESGGEDDGTAQQPKFNSGLFQDNHAPPTKGRSFFSLSTFKGSK